MKPTKDNDHNSVLVHQEFLDNEDEHLATLDKLLGSLSFQTE